PQDPPRADRELMNLRDVVAVLVQRDGVDTAKGRDRRVVRDARHGVPVLLVGTHDVFVALPAVGHAAPGDAVRMEVRLLPRAAEMRVRVPERRARERLRWRKPVNWR